MGYGDVLSGAVVLHRSRVEALNEEIGDRGEGKVGWGRGRASTFLVLASTQWRLSERKIG